MIASETIMSSCVYIFKVILLLAYFSQCSAKYSTNASTKAKPQDDNHLQAISRNLSLEFTVITNEEMGIDFIKQLYEKVKLTTTVQDVNKDLDRISHQLEDRLNDTFTVLNQTRKIIEHYYDFNITLNSGVTPCSSDYDLDEFEIPSTFVSSDNTYFEQPINIKQELRNQKARSLKIKPIIKQQYFLSTYNVLNDYNVEINNCNEQNHSLLWSTYMTRIQNKPRYVMLLLDHGGSLSKQQFRIVKAIANQTLSVLNQNDNIGILALSDDYSVPYLTEQCRVPSQVSQFDDTYVMLPGTKHNKYLLSKFINMLPQGNGATNHSLGFQQALQIIKSSNIPDNESVTLLYVSRGLLSSLTEAKTVLETILASMDDIDNKVIINTCAVIDESKPIMYETHFLRDLAAQNYSKYNIEFSGEVTAGIMLAVNSTQAVGLAVARFYNTMHDGPVTYDMSARLSDPIWDSLSDELIISATIPVGKHGQIGVLGMDLYLSDLFEDITYYSNHIDYTYAFIIDSKGIAIMHPSYPRPISVHGQPNYVDIGHLEQVQNFDLVRDLLLMNSNGEFKPHHGKKGIKYYWRNVLGVYTICVVVYEDEVPKRPHKVNWGSSLTANQLVHHRLDIIPATKMCRHLNQLATLDAGSLYLSPSCFQSPTAYMRSSTSSTFSPLTVQKCMAFLKDNTRYLSNPGLREEIRDDVETLAHILQYLRNQHLQGSKGKYVVRRYVASHSGVLEMFPGGIISPRFEPDKRAWFLRATELPSVTILTPPYLDGGGAGYIVTIAYATEHAVVGMDVTLGFIYKLIIENLPFCVEKNIKCFMMDDRGYLIYHPNLIDPNGHGPIEQKHIIHKESLVANDILNHNHFVKKVLCNNYVNGTIQRYYVLNTGLDEVLTNAVHGEHSVKYQVSAIPGTNVFIGFVNATTDVVATFCPCSMINRLCLNCNRMEQKECECPCECPLDLNSCPHPNQSLFNSSLCGITPENDFSILHHATSQDEEDLKPCLPITCEEFLSYDTCLGLLGCEWCRVDVNGISLLENPFCTSIQTCFNGVLGSPTPYGDSTDRNLDTSDLLGSGYSPIGPVMGSVLAVGLVIVFTFICYRSYTSPTVERFYLTSTQDNQVRMSDLHISDDYHELDNHQDKLLQDNKKPEPISPYCVSTGYCRPQTAADSDHGYSTMTPHDESEHLSFAPIDIDSLEDDCTSDAASMTTSVSSKRHIRLFHKNKERLLSPETSLPNRNCIIAPVTVHRNMEFTH